LTAQSKGTILILMREEYPSFLTQDSVPFDPLQIALQTEEIVSKGKSRKYTAFYCTGVYGGISTGYTVGCCLRCVFCWVDWSRDFPQREGEFLSAEQVFSRLSANAKKSGFRKMRISGGEPTLCFDHLESVLDLVNETSLLFILETNGLLLGKVPEYAQRLKKFRNIHVRVSLKAGSSEGFEKRTGGKGEFYELPFKAIEYLKQERISFHVAAMTDSRLMSEEERQMMLKKLRLIGYRDYLEEEKCDPYQTTVKRLEMAGFKLWK